MMPDVRVERVAASADTMPPDQPEADGTMQWDSTTVVVVEFTGGGRTGLGYTYSHCSIVSLITGKLAATIKSLDAMEPPSLAAGDYGSTTDFSTHAECGSRRRAAQSEG